MKAIMDLVDLIDDEIIGAKTYSEKYIECKAKNNVAMANRWKEMALDEIKHSNYIHDYTVQEIETLKTIYTAPQGMQELWDKSHKDYVEKVAWIKQMLAM